MTPCSRVEFYESFGSTYYLNFLRHSSATKIEAEGVFETSLTFYQTTRRDIPESSSVHSPRREKLRDFIYFLPSSVMLGSVGWLRTDISGLLIGPIFKSRVHEGRSPEMSVINQPTLRNMPEDGRIQVNRK
jgi:hypothetical protein